MQLSEWQQMSSGVIEFMIKCPLRRHPNQGSAGRDGPRPSVRGDVRRRGLLGLGIGRGQGRQYR